MTGRSHPTPTATATPTPTTSPTCTQLASTKGSTTSPSWLVWAGSCRTTVSLWEPLTGSKAVRLCSRRLTARLPPTPYIAANFNNTGNLDNLCNLLLALPVNLRNGNVLTFYTDGAYSNVPRPTPSAHEHQRGQHECGKHFHRRW